MHLHPLAAAIACLAQAADSLHPAEGLFDLFADRLTDGVAGMPDGARVERRATRTRLILGHVRGNAKCATVRDEVTSIVALVASQRDAAAAGQGSIDHCE